MMPARMPTAPDSSVVGVMLLVSAHVSARSVSVETGGTGVSSGLCVSTSSAWISISVSASMPTVMAMIGTPSANSISPKVRRGLAVSASVPTMATRTPKNAAISPRTSERPDSAAMKVSARKVRAASSTGPMRRARRASGSATTISTTVPRMSPATEA
jgi:hypothetical protein